MNNGDRSISLFSGIGGLDIGFSKAGYNIIAQVEIDTFCQRVLKRHAPEWWPDATIFSDVRRFGRDSIAGDIEIIFGGFPCQPHSVAGKKLGAADDRDLWPEFRRIISEFRPRTILLENVPGILAGYAVGIIADLTTLGYDCRWGIIAAADTGAPHKRERWFCMAHTTSSDARRNRGRMAEAQGKTQDVRGKSSCGNKDVGNTKGTGLSKRRHRQYQDSGTPRKTSGLPTNARSKRPGGLNRQIVTKRRLGRANHGIPAWLDKPRWPAGQGTYQHQWEAPRTIGKGIDQHRTPRIKTLGNSVMPHIAYALAIEIRGLS